MSPPLNKACDGAAQRACRQREDPGFAGREIMCGGCCVCVATRKNGWKVDMRKDEIITTDNY